jgi:hypothetical protein
MATPTKQQKRAKRAASKAKQNRMVRSGQAVKASAGDSASVEQVYNKAMESGSYDAMFNKMKEAQEGGLVPMISVFLVDPLLALVLKGHKEEHATDYIVLVFNAYRKWLDGTDEDATMAWLESDEFQAAYHCFRTGGQGAATAEAVRLIHVTARPFAGQARSHKYDAAIEAVVLWERACPRRGTGNKKAAPFTGRGLFISPAWISYPAPPPGSFALAVHQQACRHHSNAQQCGRDDLHTMVFTQRHHHQNGDDEGDGRPGQAREQPHLERDLLAAGFTLGTHAQLRHGNHQVHQQRDGAGAGQQELEHLRRGHEVGEHAEERRSGGQHHRPCGVPLGGALGMAGASPRLPARQHARGGVQRRVQAAGHGDQHHDVDDQLGIRDADAAQHGLVGTGLGQGGSFHGTRATTRKIDTR